MRRMPILRRPKPFLPRGCPRGIYAGLARLSTGCPPAEGRLHTCYSPVRRSPPGEASFPRAAPRLACVKPAASVHPEPGSNSPLYILFSFFSECLSEALLLYIGCWIFHLYWIKEPISRSCLYLITESLLLLSCGNVVIVLAFRALCPLPLRGRLRQNANAKLQHFYPLRNSSRLFLSIFMATVSKNALY